MQQGSLGELQEKREREKPTLLRAKLSFTHTHSVFAKKRREFLSSAKGNESGGAE